ncbi:hypothetical protein EV196_109130 [Mariniflexile fucanivorans]|uniref:T9SS C-terminal target domain-containing protein n=1 Tax=Mariniflexile fucanivorans TaxID=264023 RepID=A0A4R1RCE0_9FLAO|nr:hypothetical protein [Mariniflexile fucanivorans]TCL63504.1 hypothetical protein EV196_109130 [Mariniflexile fucanivorans]
MKKLNYLLISIFSLGLATGCSSDDPAIIDSGEGESGTTITKAGLITTNETWTADNIYVLSGKVVVNEGVTLTINPGTIIKGKEGQGSLASALVVDQGGILLAQGTADMPIIFTSELDNIAVGEKKGSNLTTANVGLWGGLIVLGKAPISVSGDLETKQIEGIPATDSFGQYGGTVSDDYSGKLEYISIRHGGITIGADNEINGLTLGGVGSQTLVNQIEIVANQDDAIEIFGGSVNVSNIITYAQGDDAIDLDEAWSGTLDNALVIMGADSDSAFELDGPAGSAATEAGYTINNVTLKGAGTASKYADLRDGLIANMNNILAYGFGADSVVKVNGADSVAELAADRITFSKWEIVLPSGVVLSSVITGANAGDETKFTNNATAITAASAATVGANTSGFSWTFAKSANAF